MSKIIMNLSSIKNVNRKRIIYQLSLKFGSLLIESRTFFQFFYNYKEQKMILIRTSFIRRFVNYVARSKTIDLTDLADAFVRSYGGAFEYPIGYEVN